MGVFYLEDPVRILVKLLEISIIISFCVIINDIQTLFQSQSGEEINGALFLHRINFLRMLVI